jgi:hypothetical protein
MTPLISVEEARQRLHNDVPRLFEKGTFNYVGTLRPGQTIQVEVQREDIEATVRFEIEDHATISFPHETFSNMSPRSELHAHFAREDSRIPPMPAMRAKTRGHIILKQSSPFISSRISRSQKRRGMAAVLQVGTTEEAEC